jgi:hypothetical protein
MSSTITALTGGGGVAFTGDTSGQLELKTNNGTTAVTVDTSQNLMVNSTTLFDPNGYAPSGGKFLQVKTTTTDRGSFVNIIGGGGGSPNYWVGGINYAISGQTYPAATIFSYTGASSTSGILGFTTSSDTTSTPTERMRIDSSGRLLVGTISVGYISGYQMTVAHSGTGGAAFKYDGTSETNAISLQNGNGQVGRIYTSGSNTTYATSSDYRLKENIAPMTGALAKVQSLNPVTYKWKSDGTDGQGFIAHELAEIVPDCVGGEKDAVDADGNPVYQDIDTSFLVATLTAAIQELSAEVEALKAKVGA